MDKFFESLALQSVGKEGKDVNRVEGCGRGQEKGGSELGGLSGNLQSGLRKGSPDSAKCLVDKHRLRGLVQPRPEVFGFDLKPQKRFVDQESSKLNLPRVPFLPLLSIRTNAIEELYKELKELKHSVSELEEKTKVSLQCIQMGKLKIKELEDRLSSLKKKVGIGCSADERREELHGKLKRVHKDWVKSSILLKARVLELEEEAKKLGCQSDAIRNQLFRRSKQQRVLKKNLNESGSVSEGGHRSCDNLSSREKIQSVVTTPSWNSLCIN